MPRKTPYDQLPLVPYFVAESVAETPYTGIEWSARARDPKVVAEVERKRENMTLSQVREFAEAVERKCKRAYDADADWIMRIMRSKRDKRDQLSVVIAHWLAAFLLTGKMEV